MGNGTNAKPSISFSPAIVGMIVSICALIFSTLPLVAEMSSCELHVTQGQITSSYLIGPISGDDGPSYYPHVTYEYTVNGNTYEGERIMTLPVDSGRNSALGVVVKYPNGSMVTVHYSPSDPSFAMLETGISPLSLFALMIGMLFAILTTVVTYRKSIGKRIPIRFASNRLEEPKKSIKPVVSMDLGPGEEILWKGGPSKWPFLLWYEYQGPFFLAAEVTGYAIIWTIFVLAIRAGVGAAVCGLLSITLCIVVAGVWFAKRPKIGLENVYTVTNKRLLVRIGGQWPVRKSIELSSIDDIVFSRSLLDKMFKTGTLTIVQDGKIEMVSIDGPELVRNIMIKAVMPERQT
jgi:hypothetical protein